MNVLIIDNGSRVLHKIAQIIERRHEYTIVRYDPSTPLSDESYDAIVLSGGMINEVVDCLPDGTPYFHHEFELIRMTNLPIFGICLGLQMVTVALDGTLRRLPSFLDIAANPITLNERGQHLLGTEKLEVFEKHQWAADDIEGTGLRVLAESPDCIELMYHPERNIILTQFHPEQNPENDALFWSIFELTAQTDNIEATVPQKSIELYA